jgi:hypothetical protein
VIDLEKVLPVLVQSRIDFVILGGIAAGVHGSAYPTYDLDICYSRDPANLQRIVDAIAPLHPRLRGAPPDLPFLFDAETLKRGLNFTFVTDSGDLDLLGEIAGVGGYQQARAASVMTRLLGFECPVLSLDALIASKRATGREKDVPKIIELEALREATQD